MQRPEFQFEWDENKAAINVRKHGVPFELARSVLSDPHILTVADLTHSEHEERWLSIGLAANGMILTIVYLPLAGCSSTTDKSTPDLGPGGYEERNRLLSRRCMKNPSHRAATEEFDDMPAEVDFSRGVRGKHYISANAKILMPTSIEKDVWEYFSGKAAQRGVELSELLTEVLKRDIEIHEVLK